MKPDPRCIIDPLAACHRCLADSPVTCPYRYLLGTDAAAHRRAAAQARETTSSAGGTP